MVITYLIFRELQNLILQTTNICMELFAHVPDYTGSDVLLQLSHVIMLDIIQLTYLSEAGG
jgi:hypothetical protein